MKNKAFGDLMREMQMSSNTVLPSHGYSILQLDGKAFHTWTKGLKQPFDADFTTAMDNTAVELLKTVSGAKFAYVQSDEINILVTVLNHESQAHYGNRVQKIVSTSAGLASAYLSRQFLDKNIAVFDARIFTAPFREDVFDWFTWRQSEAVKNSVRAVAHARFSHKQLIGKNTNDVKAMLVDAGDAWEDYPEGVKFGRLIAKVTRPASKLILKKGATDFERVTYEAHKWESAPAPLFKERGSLVEGLVPEWYQDE